MLDVLRMSHPQSFASEDATNVDCQVRVAYLAGSSRNALIAALSAISISPPPVAKFGRANLGATLANMSRAYSLKFRRSTRQELATHCVANFDIKSSLIPSNSTLLEAEVR